MELMNNIINKLQSLEKQINELLSERNSLKSENNDLKQRMQLIHSEMEGYLDELKEIREHYVSSNNHS